MYYRESRKNAKSRTSWNQLIEEINKMNEQGMSRKQIAEELGLGSESRVRFIEAKAVRLIEAKENKNDNL